MRREHSPSYLSFVIINVVLNMEISDERRRRHGVEDYLCTGGSVL